jgi:hypothetical protein
MGVVSLVAPPYPSYGTDLLVGSCFKVRKDNISSLVAEYLDRGFMRQ